MGETTTCDVVEVAQVRWNVEINSRTFSTAKIKAKRKKRSAQSQREFKAKN